MCEVQPARPFFLLSFRFARTIEIMQKIDSLQDKIHDKFSIPKIQSLKGTYGGLNDIKLFNWAIGTRDTLKMIDDATAMINGSDSDAAAAAPAADASPTSDEAAAA